MSRIGKKPVPLPAGVTATIDGQTIAVKGPKGTLSFKATDDVTLSAPLGIADAGQHIADRIVHHALLTSST